MGDEKDEEEEVVGVERWRGGGRERVSGKGRGKREEREGRQVGKRDKGEMEGER